jgi:hypothetical protein
MPGKISKKASAFLVLAVLAVWIAEDVYVPRYHDLRSFDAAGVASLETAMWRSYYDHRAFDLFLELTQLLRQEYGMPFWRSALAGYHAAKAAQVFQRGHNRSEYELALPDLLAYYNLVLRTSASAFDLNAVSRLELEWWIVHRESARRAPGDLESALARLQAEIYKLPVDRFAEHARARAQAMVVRDTKAESGLAASDWKQIGELLALSWSSLHGQVNVDLDRSLR